MVYILLYLAQGGCAIHEKDPAGLSADPDDAAVCSRLRRSAADRRHRSEYRATVGGASSGAGRAGDPGAVHSKGLLRRGGIQRPGGRGVFDPAAAGSLGHQRRGHSAVSVHFLLDGAVHPHRQPGGPAEQAPQTEQILHRH